MICACCRLLKHLLYDKLQKHFNGELKGKKIAMWGLAFKPETDDMREAPALVLIDLLKNAGAEIVAYDPVAMKEAQRRVGDTISYAPDMYSALKDADALMLLTEWKEFRMPDWLNAKRLMKQHVVLDGRNIYSRKELEKDGFVYYALGK